MMSFNVIMGCNRVKNAIAFYTIRNRHQEARTIMYKGDNKL